MNWSKNRLTQILRSRVFRVVFGAIIILLSLAFLGYFIWRNWATLTAYRWELDYPQVALTLVYDLIAYAVAIVGWNSIMKHLAGVDDLRFNAKVYCYGAVAGRLPGIAWGIAARVVMYAQAGISKAVSGVASLLELIITTVAGIVLVLALAPFTLSLTTKLGLWPLLGALVLGAVLTHPGLVTRVVRKVKQDALPMSLTYRDTVLWLVVYLLTWIVSGFLSFAVIRSIYPLPSRYMLQVVADWTLAGVITSFATFVPYSLGVKEVTLTLLMSRYMPEHIAVVAAILIRLATIAYSIIWMLCSTRLRGAPET